MLFPIFIKLEVFSVFILLNIKLRIHWILKQIESYDSLSYTMKIEGLIAESMNDIGDWPA